MLPYLQTIADLLQEYWWAIHAVVTSPLIGYAFVQRYKANRKKRGLNPSDLFKGNLSGVITFALTTAFWYKFNGDAEGAFYMGFIVGVLQPYTVKWFLNRVKKKSPELYESFRQGVDSDTTFIPQARK